MALAVRRNCTVLRVRTLAVPTSTRALYVVDICTAMVHPHACAQKTIIFLLYHFFKLGTLHECCKYLKITQILRFVKMKPAFIYAALSATAVALRTRAHSADVFRAAHDSHPLQKISNGWTAPTFSSVVSVVDYGAVGDGATDNTAAFNLAIAALNSTGGTVLVPSGKFVFEGSIVLPPGTTLLGTYGSVPSHNMISTNWVLPTDGSQLLPRGGRGDPNGTAFIVIQGNAVLRGFTIYYPDQVPHALPVPYPWCIVLASGSNNAAVLDVELLNAWNGIQAVGAARHYIARVQGQPINYGIYIDETYDIGRVENVHWNPWYSADPAYLAWQDTQGVGFTVGRSDWEYFFNTFVFSMSIGYRFITSPKGDGASNGNYVGIGADACQNASVWVDAADPWGILIVNGEFTSFAPAPFGPDVADHSQIIVTANNTGSVRFSNCAFWGPSNTNARLYGKGKTSFDGCVFDNWDAKKEGRASIEAYGGQLYVRGSEFHAGGASHAPEIILNGPSGNGGGVTKAIVTENMIDGAFQLVNNAGGAAQVAQANNLAS